VFQAQNSVSKTNLLAITDLRLMNVTHLPGLAFSKGRLEDTRARSVQFLIVTPICNRAYMSLSAHVCIVSLIAMPAAALSGFGETS
jgi:hypothetical protein